ncbi:hypothetical protein CPB83DRAFT_862503 [Crepidotus variabilis]|uniref:F-box domain-containing protein n=1 Tax=Crepidotus variabilis TaxID=179855 RepID=A0A9P6JK77_9AGAR|nr:hypothetical protein CPB83DRAFT_862503 [Crepidotus variabilis]
MASISPPVPLIDKLTVFQHLNIVLDEFENKELSSLDLLESPAEYDIFLNRLHRLSSGLASYRNTFIPINRLPADILTQIFGMIQIREWYCEDETIFSDLCYSDNPAFSSWLKPFTEVCHYWRQITTSTKYFWRTIWLSHRYQAVDLMKLFLARSSPLPFRVKWFHTASHDRQLERDTALALVKKEAYRLELLQVLGPLTQYPEFDQSVLDDPLPNLRFLSLPVRQYKGRIVDSLLAPNLQRLSLQAAASLPDAISPSITHLRLSDLNKVPEIWQFLQLLQTTPLLEQFEWNGFSLTVPSSTASYHNLHPVALPHLQKIELYYSHPDPDAWETPLLLLHKINLSKSVKAIWCSKAPPSSATLRTEPIFRTAEFLLCNENTACISHNGVLTIPKIEFLDAYEPHLLHIRAFASSNKLPENMMEIYPQISTSLVEEFHTAATKADLQLFNNLEKSVPCLFPQLRVFSLWLRSWESFKMPFILQGNDQLADLWQCLLKTGQVKRARLDGSTYVVKLCREKKSGSRVFTFDWMVDECRTLKVGEGN